MTHNDEAVLLWNARTGVLIRSLDLSAGWSDFSWWGASIVKVAFVEQGQTLAFFVKTLRGGAIRVYWRKPCIR